MANRAIVNATKQISRSGWIAWSSIAVMALAFFVGSVFAGIAYVAHLKIQSIETRDNMLVFFEEGTDPALISRLRSKWEQIPQIRSIGYTTEEEAYNKYFEDTRLSAPIENQLLQQKETKTLPSSLDIRLQNLDYLEEVRDILVTDINGELERLEYRTGSLPIDLKIDDRSLEQMKEVFLVVRLAGIFLITLLFIIIFFFILMTVEYRTYNRMEEIGVMQLVGGSLSYIRAPFILEGGFYGAIGAFISTAALAFIGVFLLVINSQSSVSQYLYQQLASVEFPQVTIFGWLAIVAAMVAAGGLLGSLISYLAIRRYIK